MARLPRHFLFAGLLIPAVAIVSIVACGSSNPGSGSNGLDADSGGTPPDDVYIECVHDIRVEPYTANMTKTSSGQTFLATLQSANPAPPGLDENTWMVHIVRA
ncbi:MAG TPA: hypothetical protein VNO21_26945, partial [Polyangiaceae bacterium]|nr:hypothetical protein [Polyangiaceae bacterium]